MSYKIKEFFKERKQKIYNFIYLIAFFLWLPVINLCTKVLFNLGIYTGTFIRFLYDIVTY